MKKKMLAIILCVAMTVLLLPVYSFAGYDETGTWVYSVSNEYQKTARMLYYYGDDIDVVVPGYIDGYKIISLNGPTLFKGNDKIRSVVIPDTVYGISSKTFADCTSLESVYLSKNVNDVGNQAFLNCPNLKLVTFENPNTDIAFDAFKGITSNRVERWFVIASTGSGKVRSFAGNNGYYYFPVNDNYEVEIAMVYDPVRYASPEWTEGLIDYTSSYAVVKKYTGSETDVKLSRDYGFVMLSEIGRNAFECCDFIETVSLPYQIEYIDEYAFRNCTSLRSIALPETVKSIDPTAFDGCSSFDTVYGLKSTYAEEFALANNYNFIAVGDIDGDGEITLADYSTVKSHIYGFNEIAEQEYYLTDMNSDFSIDAFDLFEIDRTINA